MHLLIDQGNSRVKACTLRAGQLQFVDLSKLNSSEWALIQEVLIASVASEAEKDALVKRIPSAVAVRFIKSSQFAFGLRSGYDIPEKLGVDRWLAMLGALKCYPSEPLLVIDAGTALTLDWVDAKGQHLGGWILAGLQTQQKILVSATAQVQSESVVYSKLEPGTNTIQAVANGAKAALLGAITHALAQQDVQRVIVTGGDADFIFQSLNHPGLVLDQKLIFHGLACFIND